MNTTIITSKGTTTIPKHFRDSLGLSEGSMINFEMSKSGRLFIDPVLPIEELRRQNQIILAKNKETLKNYSSGDGFRARAKAILK